MVERKRINAHAVIVSHPPYVEREGACLVDRVEWLILHIFASHFKRVTLLRPRAQAGEEHKDWVRLPEYVDVRELRGPGDEMDRLRLYAGLGPRRLPELIRDADVVYGRLAGFEAYYALRLAKR